jgi:hypothetical protein
MKAATVKWQDGIATGACMTGMSGCDGILCCMFTCLTDSSAMPCHQSFIDGVFFVVINNESVPGSGTARDKAPQGHKLPVPLPFLHN